MSIVVAYSRDPFGSAVLDHGARAALEDGSRLVVVNATKGDSYVDPRFAADDEVAAIEADLGTRGVEVVVRHEVVPDVADAVLAAAQDTGATLIVVGVRRRSPVGKMLMGSVAQRVILEAHCPVLAVKPPE